MKRQSTRKAPRAEVFIKADDWEVWSGGTFTKALPTTTETAGFAENSVPSLLQPFVISRNVT